ncbi:hypothetical protein QFZ55_000318 [Streptomyces luteogriseus]|nr:hypothetical protein [Streptomyces luteogriseus]
MARELPDGPSAAPVTYIEGAHALLVRGDPASRAVPAEAGDRFRAAGQAGDAHMATMLWAMAEAFFGTRASASSARDVKPPRPMRAEPNGPAPGPGGARDSWSCDTAKRTESLGPPAAGPGAAAGDRGRLGSGLGPGDTGLGGGGHRRRHPGGVAPGRRPPHASGHGGGADRPAPVPRGAPHSRATGARVPGRRDVRGGLVPGVPAPRTPRGPVPEEGTSQVRSTRTRTGGSRTPTA